MSLRKGTACRVRPRRAGAGGQGEVGGKAAQMGGRRRKAGTEHRRQKEPEKQVSQRLDADANYPFRFGEEYSSSAGANTSQGSEPRRAIRGPHPQKHRNAGDQQNPGKASIGPGRPHGALGKPKAAGGRHCAKCASADAGATPQC